MHEKHTGIFIIFLNLYIFICQHCCIFFIVLMLSGLIDTFFSRTSWNMLLYSENHTHWIPYFYVYKFSTHMPLARHDGGWCFFCTLIFVSTHMPLARHDGVIIRCGYGKNSFYSHASCEAWRTSPAHRQATHAFLLTCLLRGMTHKNFILYQNIAVSTHMPLARHDFPYLS